MYMVVSLILLCVLSLGLAYIWHRRINGFDALLKVVRSQFDSGSAGSQERAYGHCISHKWVLDNVVGSKESNIGNSIRNFINDRTVMGFFTMGVLILPTTAILVILLYRTFALLGASIGVLIVAVFLVRASGDVLSSYGLLSWLMKQDYSKLKEDDIVYAEVSLKTITDWRRLLVLIALISLIAAPWGELIPQAIALATSGYLVTIFGLVYPPVAVVSHRIAVLAILYLVPLGVALLYLIFQAANRVSAYFNGELLRNL